MLTRHPYLKSLVVTVIHVSSQSFHHSLKLDRVVSFGEELEDARLGRPEDVGAAELGPGVKGAWDYRAPLIVEEGVGHFLEQKGIK